MTLRATKKVRFVPLLILAICIILLSLIVIPFFVLPLIAYSLDSLMLPVFGVGFFILIPFLRIDKTVQGIGIGILLVVSALFISFTGILFTYHEELRWVVLIAIPVVFSILSGYYLYKSSKEWNRRFNDQISSSGPI